MTDATPALGFIGIGLMGLPMTRRLLAAGYGVTVWNRTRAKIEAVLADGAVEGGSPREVAEAADIVFACVTDTGSVEAVVFGPGGVAEAEGAGKVFVDHSSIRPEATREMAARLMEANGMAWIDAPVSGGVAGAEQGTLAMMAGGERAAFEKIAPVLAHTSGRCTLMGPSGAGQTTKLCNAVICWSAFAGIAEATRLATNAGVDAALLPEALAGGWADSLPFQIFVPRMLAGVDEPLGHTDTALKDIDSALDLGRATGAPMPMTATVQQLFRLLLAQGHAKSEPSVLYDFYGEKGAG